MKRDTGFLTTAGFLAFPFTLVFAFVASLGKGIFLIAPDFLFAAPVLATERFIFATGRFFAMNTLLSRGLTATRDESSPEKVCCHLGMTRQSATRIA